MKCFKYDDTLDECKEIIDRIYDMISQPPTRISSADILAKQFLLREDIKEILKIHDKLNYEHN